MRSLLIITLCCLCSYTGQSQAVFSALESHVFYGSLNLGTNFSQIDGDGFSGYHKVGVAGGASVYVRPFRELPWSLLAASLGIGFTQKGSAEASLRETSLGPAVFRYRAHLQYAEVPLLLHFLWFGRVHYTAGISYGRLLSSTETSEDINIISISPELYPFRKQDWCGIAGFGIRLYGPWFVSGQFQYTIGSIRDEPYIPPGYGFGHQRNNVVTLRLMYLIASGNAR